MTALRKRVVCRDVNAHASEHTEFSRYSVASMESSSPFSLAPTPSASASFYLVDEWPVHTAVVASDAQTPSTSE